MCSLLLLKYVREGNLLFFCTLLALTRLLTTLSRRRCCWQHNVLYMKSLWFPIYVGMIVFICMLLCITLLPIRQITKAFFLLLFRFQWNKKKQKTKKKQQQNETILYQIKSKNIQSHLLHIIRTYTIWWRFYHPFHTHNTFIHLMIILNIFFLVVEFFFAFNVNISRNILSLIVISFLFFFFRLFNIIKYYEFN